MNLKPIFDVFFHKNGDMHKHRKNGNLYRDFYYSANMPIDIYNTIYACARFCFYFLHIRKVRGVCAL